VVNFFHKVPNGTYNVVVDALDASGNSIVQGDAQTSQNTVTVAAPNVTYSDGDSCLKVRLKLLNATGEGVGSRIIVEDGDEWTGTPQMSPGGNCPTCGPQTAACPVFDLNNAQAGHVYTLVGTGEAGTGADGALNGSMGLSTPVGVAPDRDGNLVIADYYNGRLLITPRTNGTYFDRQMQAGHSYVLAGGLGDVHGVTLDAGNNIYFTTYYGGKSYLIPRVAGTYFGKAMAANSASAINDVPMGRAPSIALSATGNLFVSENWTADRIFILPKGADSYYGHAASENTLTQISDLGGHGVTVDRDDNVYGTNFGTGIAYIMPRKSGTYFGRAMQADTQYVLAGGAPTVRDGVLPTESSIYPEGVAVDHVGNLYFGDMGNHRIRMIPRVAGTYFGQVMQAKQIYTIAGGGSFTADGVLGSDAALNLPCHLFVDPSGNVIFSDNGSHQVRVVVNTGCQ
jgi:hypothetical protein